MSCGPCLSPCYRATATHSASGGGSRGLRSGSVPRRFSTFCGPGVSGVRGTPTELCPPSTAHARFQEWVAAGVLLKLWKAGVEQCEDLKGSEWHGLSREGARTKAPLGGEKNRPPSDRRRQTGRQPQPADRSPGGPDRLGYGGRQSA